MAKTSHRRKSRRSSAFWRHSTLRTNHPLQTHPVAPRLCSSFRVDEGVPLETSRLSLVTDWDIPLWATCALVAVSAIYVRGWKALHRTRPAMLPTWRLVVFLFGTSA